MEPKEAKGKEKEATKPDPILNKENIKQEEEEEVKALESISLRNRDLFGKPMVAAKGKRKREEEGESKESGPKPKVARTNRQMIEMGQKSLYDFLNRVLPEDKKKYLKDHLASVPVEEFDRQWRERVIPIWKYSFKGMGISLIIKRMLVLSEVDIKQIGSTVEEGKELLKEFAKKLEAICRLIDSLPPLSQ